MFPILIIAFIVVPLAELAVIITVGQQIGVLPTIVILLAISLLGAWLAKHQGLGVLRRIREQIDAGRVPGAELVDGAMVLVGAALLLTPGFLTDAVGIGLLLPPVRAMLRRTATRFIVRRARIIDVIDKRTPNHRRVVVVDEEPPSDGPRRELP